MVLEADRIVLRGARRVVTCAGDRSSPTGALENVEVLVEHGRVAAVLPAGAVTSPDVLAHDLKGALLTPALIDCHTHPAFMTARTGEWLSRLHGASYEDIAAAGGGILSSVRSLRAAGREALTRATLRNLLRLRAHGVAFVEGKSGYGLSLEHEIASLEAIGAAAREADMLATRTCLAAHSLPAEYRGEPARRDAYIELVCRAILPEVARRGLAERADVFCERGAFTPEQTLAVGRAARELGLRMTIHADQLSASGGARAAAELEADSADHLEFTGEADQLAMLEAGVSAVLLPGSTFHLRQERWADARGLIARGLNVALSTDFNPGSSPICSPAFIMHLAVTKLAMTPAQALLGFTVNAARALRIKDGEAGVIAPGARAAFATWDLDHEDEIAAFAGSNLCTGVLTCRNWQA
jgi:imidazolonepropionase